MFCINCGKQVADNYNFCTNCGAQLSKSTSTNSARGNIVVETSQNTEEVLLASQGKRFSNLILDFVFLYIFAYCFGLLLGITGLYTILDIESMNDTVLGIILLFLYYGIFEVTWGKTPAKFLTKTKVVMSDGSKADLPHIAGRTAARLIPFEAFSFLSKNPRGWHDSLSNTKVINS